MNHEFKFPTKITWQPITVKLIDSFQANMGSKFYNLMRGAGYVQPETMDQSLVGITKANMAAAVGEITIRQLDGGNVVSSTPDKIGDDPTPDFYAGDVREEWKLVNGIITKVSWGEGMSYSETGIVEVEVGLEYDFAYYNEYGPTGP